ncbi:hypothetical protein DQ04_02311100 [Trypanosoma grayi]|uniref:hypothetical protein n=1 Tax=Trypanosoma grayi TaxID=71804 RepID=UPI0004F420C0|nr:hypothetical protein DQ04_02311100 [Trypanosoma grayi]KEG11758.1 hypothetical protein DQ04_02311100 [Trypanosoma grayi]
MESSACSAASSTRSGTGFRFGFKLRRKFGARSVQSSPKAPHTSRTSAADSVLTVSNSCIFSLRFGIMSASLNFPSLGIPRTVLAFSIASPVSQHSDESFSPTAALFAALTSCSTDSSSVSKSSVEPPRASMPFRITPRSSFTSRPLLRM